jgi:hypothetical protein
MCCIERWMYILQSTLMRCLGYKINICFNVVCVVTKSNLQVIICEKIWDTMKVGHKQAYV